MSDLNEVYSEDLGFKLATPDEGVALFDAPIDVSTTASFSLSLLAVSNQFGYFAASDSKKLIIDKLDKLDQDDASPDSFKSITLSSQITQLQFTAAGDRLYLIIDQKLSYIALSSATGDSFSTSSIHEFEPFADYTISKFQCSPINSNSITAIDINNNLLVSDGQTSLTSDVTAASYSLDGNTIYYATGTSVKALNTPDFEISALEELDEPNASVITLVQQLDPTNWLVVYDISEDKQDLENYDVKTFVITKSNVYETFIAVPENMVQRSLTYYHQILNNWIPQTSLAFIASSKTTELSTISTSSGESASIVQENDSDKATMPLDDLGEDDASAVGFALDLYSNKTLSVAEPCMGVDEATGKLPRVLLLTDQGKLVAWWVFDMKSLKEGKLSLDSVTQSIGSPLSSQPEIKASSQVDQQPEIDTQSPQTKPFGSSSFDSKPQSNASGSSAFGAKSDAAFGSTGFGNNKSTNSGNFGSTGFGNDASTKSSSFGSTGFGNNNSTNSGSFGSTGFGSEKASSGNPLASSSGFKGSGFGNASSNNGAFGSTGFASMKGSDSGSVFGSGKPTSSGTGSNFGSFANMNPTAKLTQNSGQSIFGKSSESGGSSPFASLGENDKSPFGQAQPAKGASPFSKLGEPSDSSSPLAESGKKEPETAKSNSPFGQLGKQDTQTTNQSSPFAKLGKAEAQPASGSPFGQLGKQETKAASSSPFGQPEKQEAQPASGSPFGQLGKQETKPASSSPFSQLGKQETQPAKQASPFAKLDANAPQTTKSSLSFGGKDSDAIKPSPAQDRTQPKQSSPFANMSESTPTTATNSKSTSSFSQGSSLFGQVKSNQKDTKASPFEGFGSALDDSLNASAKNNNTRANERPFFSSIGSTDVSQSSTNTVRPQAQSQKRFSVSSAAADEPYEVIEPPSDDEGQSVLGYSDSEEFDNYDVKAIMDKQPRRQSNETFYSQGRLEQPSSESRHTREDPIFLTDSAIFETEDYNDYVAILSSDPSPLLPQLLYFAGFNQNETNARPRDALGVIRKMCTDTAGFFEVLNLNLNAIREFVDLHGSISTNYTSETLEHPGLWKLGALHLFHEAIRYSIENAEDYNDAATSQFEALTDIRKRVEVSREYESVIDKLITQLKVFEHTGDKYKHRGLDVQQEITRSKLRTKYARVLDQIEATKSKLLPFKAKTTSKSTRSFENLERVIYELNNRITQSLQNVELLESQIDELGLAKKKMITDTESVTKDLAKISFDAATSKDNSRISKGVHIGPVRSRAVNFQKR